MSVALQNPGPGDKIYSILCGSCSEVIFASFDTIRVSAKREFQALSLSDTYCPDFLSGINPVIIRYNG